jgi:hypothetical protein
VNRVGILCAAGVLAGGILLSGQVQPPEPRKQFGASITGAYEGWYYNADGSRSFLVGYYNRNSQQSLDIPIGANNRIEPGGDLGQPTYFLPGRQWGMFVVPAPKDFKPTDSYVWTIVANGQSTSIPLRLHPDYIMSPFKEIAVDNTPPIIKFEPNGKTIQGPLGTLLPTPIHNATVGTPTPLELWASDDAKYTSGSNAPMGRPRPAVELRWSKYRGPGAVTFDKARPEFEKVEGAAVFNGHAKTNAKFSEPGDYILHVTANDYSGDGGGGFGCCWTTSMVKVSVKP